jgi:hypothetical protein
MTDHEDRLAVLRAELAEAEAARERAGDDRRKTSVRAAEAHHAAAEKALADAHLDAKRAADEQPAWEIRPAAKPAEVRSDEDDDEAEPVEDEPAEKPAKPEAAAKPEPAAKPAPAPSHKKQTLQELNQSASTQDVRYTAALTPQQHSRRRNPKRT